MNYAALSLLLVFCFSPLLSQADTATDAKDGVEQLSADGEENGIDERPRFSIYKRNFVLWSIPDNAKDERGLQIRFSAQYRFLECTNKLNNGVSYGTCAIFDWKPLTDYVGRLNMSFSYTTDFDFYVRSDGTRELSRQSRPVRNRMTSPAFHFNWERENKIRSNGVQYRSFTFSLVHHSNGQDLELHPFLPEGATDAQILESVAELASDDPAWMDTVSRGWNYVELLSRFDAGMNLPNCSEEFLCASLSAGVRFAFKGSTNPIWWEPGNDSKYLDYNRFTFQLVNEWGRDIPPDSQFFSTGKKRFSLDVKCGSGGCSSNASLRANVYMGEGNFQLPLMIYGHFGKNEHFYNYHETANMIGLGLEFSQ